MLSTFPPNQAEGAFGSRLPQIVLKRRTLPWERELDGKLTTSGLPRQLPWLALVVLADAEGEVKTARPIAECVTPGVVLEGRNDATIGDCLVTTDEVVRRVFPTQSELELLAHVRHVDMADTELALGDDDGWMAVVLSNRLPQPGVRYRACLISIEGQYSELPVTAEVDEFFTGAFVYPYAAAQYDKISYEYAGTVDGGGIMTPRPAYSEAALSAAAARLDPTAVADVAGAVRFAAAGGGQGAAALAAQDSVDLVATRTAHAAASRSLTVHDAWSTVDASARSTSALAASAPAAMTATLIGAMHSVNMAVIAPQARQLTFPVLAQWQFTCTGSGDFQSLMQNLDVGMLGTPPRPPDPPAPGEKPTAPATRPPVEVLDTGHLALAHTSRAGESGSVWYRGPLVPRPTNREQPDGDGLLALAHSSDQVRRIGPDGRENLSLATAFDIGRLLALAEPSVVAALLTWRKEALAAATTQTLLAGEPSLGAYSAGALAGFGARAGLGLLTSLGTENAARLGVARPLFDLGRPIEGIDGVDPIEVLSVGLGVEPESIKALLDPSVGPQRTSFAVPVAVQLTDVDKLLGNASQAFGHLNSLGESTVQVLNAQANGPVEAIAAGGAVGAVDAAPAAADQPPDALDRLLAERETR